MNDFSKGMLIGLMIVVIALVVHVAFWLGQHSYVYHTVNGTTWMWCNRGEGCFTWLVTR